ncbi:Hint domain-containing protein [Roseivivax marinus]|nr:Hint domain-containing protein [Roseivivax marinus]
MTRPAPYQTDYRDALSLTVPRDRFARSDGRPRRAPSLMRRYEAAALLPDLTIRHTSVTAPALPVFEEATAAFARGTLVQTVGGPVAVEDLLPGDYLETTRGPEPVVWIGSTSFIPNVQSTDSGLLALTRIVAEAMGPAKPGNDLVLGPGARMVEDCARLKTLIGQSRVLVPVTDQRDGDRILEIRPAGSVDLYHLALRHHGTIRVGGLELESYHPGTTIKRRLDEETMPLFRKLFPHLEGFDGFGELNLPRTTREVLDSLGSR